MNRSPDNNAYIDGANLHYALRSMGWKLDYTRFRVWLRERFAVKEAYIFLGYVAQEKILYEYLERCGFILIFKEVSHDRLGNLKGNCDSDLVLRVAQDAYEERFDRAIIVSSDGDFASLIVFLQRRKRLEILVSPSPEDRCSTLLKRTQAPITFLDRHRDLFELRNKKAPDEDGTS